MAVITKQALVNTRASSPPSIAAADGQCRGEFGQIGGGAGLVGLGWMRVNNPI